MARRWFHQDLSGPEAEELLMKSGNEGSFVVRPSTTKCGDYVLCVRQGNEVHHIKIQNTGDYYDLYGGEKFATLGELVLFHMEVENRGILCLKEASEPLLLSQPLPCGTLASQRWFHGTLHATNAEQLLLAPRISAGYFLMRESTSRPGELVLAVRSQEQAGGNKGQPVIMHVRVQCKEGLYNIGDDREYDSLENLVDFYRSNAITAHTTSHPDHTFFLTKPLCASCLVAAELPERVQELEGTRHGGSQMPRGRARVSRGMGSTSFTNGFGLEYETLQLDGQPHMTRTAGQDPRNKSRNRFKNILPFDETRVVLKGDHDYINANYIELNAGDAAPSRRYIATQGCLQGTVADLWSMVMQERSRVIVMATQEVERGKNKCFRYWPEEDSSRSAGRLTVRCKKEWLSNDYTVRVMDVTAVDGDGECHEVYQFQFKAWPDHDVPTNPQVLLRFLDQMNRVQEKVPDSGPIIVHCSAGIGRTGTLIAIDALKEQIKWQGLECELDIPRTIQEMRSQRSGMVQTEAQYTFVYKCLEVFVLQEKRKLEGGVEEEEEFEEPAPKRHSSPIYENLKPTDCSISLG